MFTCSIYKAVLKSKGSINEVNQIAQVCSAICLGLHWNFCWGHLMLNHISSLTYSFCSLLPASYCYQTKAMHWCRAFVHPAAGISLLMPRDREFLLALGTSSFLIVIFSADLLPCSWVGSWNLDPYSSNCAFISSITLRRFSLIFIRS